MLLDSIKSAVNSAFTTEFIQSLKTQSGNTQSSERTYIQKLKECLLEIDCKFDEASSQRAKDFQNVTDGVDCYNIEAKKTDTTTIIFNDTLPTADVLYFVIFTGNTRHPPQTFWCSGDSFTNDSPWIHEYNKDIQMLLDKWGRGSNKKSLEGIMKVYPRPNYSADITKFLV